MPISVTSCPTFAVFYWQDGDLPWGASTHVVTWSFNQVALWGHLTNWIFYISTCTRPINAKHRVRYPLKHVLTWGHVTNELGCIPICSRPMAIKGGSVVTCHERISHDLKKGHVTVIRSSDKTDKIISPLSQELWPVSLVGCWVQGENSKRTPQSCHRLLVSFS